MLDNLNHWINEKLREFSIMVLGIDPFAVAMVRKYGGLEKNEKEENDNE